MTTCQLNTDTDTEYYDLDGVTFKTCQLEGMDGEVARKDRVRYKTESRSLRFNLHFHSRIRYNATTAPTNKTTYHTITQSTLIAGRAACRDEWRNSNYQLLTQPDKLQVQTKPVNSQTRSRERMKCSSKSVKQNDAVTYRDNNCFRVRSA